VILPLIKKKSGLLAEWLILLSCFGYPLQAMVVVALKVDSTIINTGFRAAYLAMAAILLLMSLLNVPEYLRTNPHRKFPTLLASFTPLLVLSLFWIIYGIRLVYELEYQDWRMQHYSDFYIYSWAFGCSMIPAMAVLMHAGSINSERFTRNLIILLGLANVAIVYGLWHYSPSGLHGILGERMTITLPVKDDRPDQSLLNPITIGLYGSWLALAALTWVFLFRKKLPVWVTLLLIPAFLLGLFNLMASASRGPLAGFLLIAAGLTLAGSIRVFTWIRKPKHRPEKYSVSSVNQDQIGNRVARSFRISASGVIWSVVLVALLLLGIWRLRSMDIGNYALLDRIHQMILEQQDGQGNIRLAIWKSAWHQFTVNPIFGDSIINDKGYFYSHNIFMDALMSVGIVGTIPFLVWFFLSFWYFIRLPAHRKRELSVLFVAYLAALLLSMTSGGIFTVPEVWILSAAVIGLSQKYLLDEERTKSGQRADKELDEELD